MESRRSRKAHAKALVESEARYRLLAENASDVVTMGGNDGLWLWVSPSVERLLGWRPQQLIGEPAREYFHPEDLGVIGSVHEALLRGEPGSLEARFRTRVGAYRWVSVQLKPVFDEHGNVVGRVGGWRDVQAEHEARDAIEASEARFRLLAEHAADVVYHVGPDRLVTWISSNVGESLGWSVEDIIGAPMFGLIHPDDQALVSAARDGVFEDQSIANPVGGYECRFRCQDGSYKWMSLKSTTVSGPDGDLSAVVVGLRDVDALLEARRRTAATKELLRASMNAVPDPLVLLGAVRHPDIGDVVDFRYLDVNTATCEYLATTREDLIGRSFLETAPGQRDRGLFALYVAAMGADEPTVVNDFEYENEIIAETRRYDVRAARVSGDRLSVTWRDVTDRHIAAQLIAESEERYRVLAEHSADVVLQERDGIIRWLSPALTSTLGWAPGEWVGHAFKEFVHSDDIALAQQRWAGITVGATRATTLRVRDAQGAFHWTEVHAGPSLDAHGKLDGMIASFRVVDTEVAAREVLEHLAQIDILTGVLNRKEILRRLGDLSSEARRLGEQTAVLFCDIDRFKDINDVYGHAVGDAVLRRLAERMSEAVSAEDCVARIGGDELLVVLSSVHSLDDAAEVAERIRDAASKHIGHEDARVSTTLSIGVTLMRPGEDVDSLVARADQAMYEAKGQGRNQVVVLDADRWRRTGH